MPPVCLDASLVLLWFLREPLSTRADALLQEWRTNGVEFIAPSLLMLEVPSVLRQAVHRGRVTTAEGDETLHAFLEMDIRIREPSDLLNRTWELGKTLNAPRLYDMYYLAQRRHQRLGHEAPAEVAEAPAGVRERAASHRRSLLPIARARSGGPRG